MTSPSPKLKSIVLNRQQARVLAESGELVLFDVLDEQPRSEWSHIDQRPSGDWYEWWDVWVAGGRVDQQECNIACPFAPGDRLWVAQEWQCGIEWDDTCDDDVDPLCGGNDVWFPADGEPVDGYGRTRPASGMPLWACRSTLTTASVEPVEHEGKWCWRRVMKKFEERDE